MYVGKVNLKGVPNPFIIIWYLLNNPG